MTYRAPAANIEFTLSHVIGADRLTETGKYGEATADLRMAILTEAGKMAEDVLAPLQRAGDLEGAKLENGVVRASPGYDQGYKAIREGGWVAVSAPEEFGGMGLPMILTTAVNEMMSSSCLSLSLNPLMTQGQIDALEHHASDEIKATYLPKLIEGSWTGTMNLTEPQAGSDVGALRSKAEPNDDGSYSVSGQKIYISWGDHDLAENICHLVLARLPDAPAGTKGVSLFIVPKLIPDENGEPGVANSLKPISLEHKLGLHGSPTCVMQFDDAKGWMVGPENGGMACMFTMMNNARLGVGVEGLGVAEAATQKAVAYAMDRKQGRTPLGDKGTGAIIDHADGAPDADDNEGADVVFSLNRSRHSIFHRYVQGDRGCRMGRPRRVPDTYLQGVLHRYRQRGRASRRAGAWRHGLCRGNRRSAVFPRCAGDRDL